MNVGIIGSGKVGSALGELWAAGHQVMFSFSRSPERLQTLATRIGMRRVEHQKRQILQMWCCLLLLSGLCKRSPKLDLSQARL